MMMVNLKIGRKMMVILCVLMVWRKWECLFLNVSLILRNLFRFWCREVSNVELESNKVMIFIMFRMKFFFLKLICESIFIMDFVFVILSWFFRVLLMIFRIVVCFMILLNEMIVRYIIGMRVNIV